MSTLRDEKLILNVDIMFGFCNNIYIGFVNTLLN